MPDADGWELEHEHPRCSGRWKQERHGLQVYWRCERCRAVCYDCSDVLRAAVTENAMGATLNTLARTGKELLEERRWEEAHPPWMPESGL